MGQYILRRLVGVVAVILGLILFTFFATRLIGDPVSLMVDRETSTEADIQAIREANGLDDPMIVQFGNYVTDVLRGDFG